MEWISVKDSLPEIGVPVLIFDYGNMAVSQRGRHRKGDAIGFMDDQDEQPGYYYPTHWMPLPEPPTSNP